MGLLSWLTGGAAGDPTREWVKNPGLLLEVDLGRHTVNGVGLGEAIDGLRGLGPVEDRKAARSGDLSYGSRGLRLGAEAGRLDSFFVAWDCAWEPEMKRFGGRVFRDGEEVALGPETTEAELERLFGAPYWRSADEDEVLLFYEWERGEWQVELSPEGRLRALLVVAEPLLADPKARADYGVTRDWPPRAEGG